VSPTSAPRRQTRRVGGPLAAAEAVGGRRGDLRNVRDELRADIRALDERLRAVEAGQAEIRGQLTLMRNCVLGRNLRQPENATEPAPGD